MVPNEGLVFVEVRAMATTNPQPQSRIFMSYRRDETDFPASWLYDRLAAHFGHDKIFKDVDSIEPGDDFGEVIARAVGSCDVLLALIGEYWVSITDSDGKPRLDDPDDFVRLEIEAALQRGVRVIPILVGDAAMPRADQLPETLRRLARRQALELSPKRFEADVHRLLRVLERTLAEQAAEQPPPADVASTSDVREKAPLAAAEPPAAVGVREVPAAVEPVQLGPVERAAPAPRTGIEPVRTASADRAKVAGRWRVTRLLKGIPMGRPGRFARPRWRLALVPLLVVMVVTAVVLWPERTDPTKRMASGTTVPTTTTTRPPEVRQLLADNFSTKANGWKDSDDAKVRWWYQDGQYHARPKVLENIAISLPSARGALSARMTDVRIDLDGGKVSGSDNHRYGAVCRYTSEGYYRVLISADGTYRIFKHVGEKRSDLVTKTPSPIIKRKGMNHLTVTCEGGQRGEAAFITLMVNGKLVKKVADRDRPWPSGMVGLATHAHALPLEIAFDNFEVSTV
jgi:TIR domain